MLGCQQNTQVKNQPTTTTKNIKVPTISVQEKKAKFKEAILPKVQEVYSELNFQYNEIKTAIQNNTQLERIERLKKAYKAKSNEELLMALKPHPISLTLAQAAMESSWGTSRFYKEAKNVFGVWSFNKNEPRIAASGQRGTKTIWLKKYATLKDSIRDYYKNLGRSFAFKEFRQEKINSNNPYILVTKLDRYSEKGSLYGKELTAMISYNKFIHYDDTFFERPKKVEPKVETSNNEIQTETVEDSNSIENSQITDVLEIPQEKSQTTKNEELVPLDKISS